MKPKTTSGSASDRDRLSGAADHDETVTKKTITALEALRAAGSPCISAYKLLLSRRDIKALGIYLSNSQLLRLEARNRFPRRIRMGAGSVCWDAVEILQWIEDKRRERLTHHYAPLD